MRAWEEFLLHQEKELGSEIIEKWLRPLKLVRFDACNVYLEAPDSFQALWFEEHMRHRVDTHLFNNNHKPIKVHITISTELPQKEKTPKKQTPSSSPFQIVFDTTHPECTFETFVPSDGNLLAYKLLQEVCQVTKKSDSPPLSFNPIYLFGRSGTGKTHLLMAAANALKAQGGQVIFVRAETFTEHVVNAIRTAEMQQFRKVYRTVDALIIDDIEVFSRKGATQEELFHTFNTLHTAGKQIILSGNSPPQDLKWIEPRLVSRFEWGIVIPIQSLPQEAMREILVKKAKQRQFLLSEPILAFLLETFGNNAKSLMRAFEALLLRTHLHMGNQAASSLSVATARQLLSDLAQEEEKNILTPSKILRTVAEYYGIRMDDILGKSQSRECALPRQIAMHLCREQLHLPYMKIGDIFARDHSTVMSSVKQIQKGLETKNLEISGSINTILKRLEIH